MTTTDRPSFQPLETFVVTGNWLIAVSPEFIVSTERAIKADRGDFHFRDGPAVLGWKGPILQ